MKVLFIVPPDKNPKKNFFLFGRKIGIYIPLSIAQIAAVLETQNHTVCVLDLRLSNKDIEKETLEKISNYKPDLIGFTSSFFSAKIIFELAKAIKSRYSIPIVLGGPYATVFSKKILLEQKSIDIIVLYEGDYTIGEILKAIKKKRSLKKIKDICFIDKKKGDIIYTKTRPIIDDLDILPYPAFHLFDFNRYIPSPKHYKKLPLLPIITGRGCVYGKCSFCYQPKRYGKRQSPKKIVSQIKHFKKVYGIKEVRFWDDVFLYDKKWIFGFCDLLKKKHLDIVWGCHARVDMVTKEMLEKVAKAGCWQILYGIESGNLQLLKNVSKGITKEQAINAVKWTKEAGIEVRISCIIGLPGETPERTDKTIKFAHELNPDIVQFSYATPYPGTKMYEQLKNSCRLNKKIDDFSEIKAVYVPEGYNEKKYLEKKFRDAYRGYYLNPKYIIKNLSKIRNTKDIRRFFDGLAIALGMSS